MEVYLFAAILPVFILCYYIYKKDVNREPNRVLWKIFGFGCLISVPIFFIEVFIQLFYSVEDTSSFLSLFANVFISIAFIEEGFKWVVTKKYGYNIKEFDELYDIVVYAVFASLGFACVENILYVFSNGIGNAILRAFTSVPGHTCFGVIMGYFLSLAKVNEIREEKDEFKKNLFLSILIPTALHTLYDAILLYSIEIQSFSFLLLFLGFLIVMFFSCFKVVNKVASSNQNLYVQQNLDIVQKKQDEGNQEIVHFCYNCGSNVDGCNYCTNCGTKV